MAPSSDLDLTIERITSLLLVRLVAIHAPRGKYQDLSTTTICRTNLMAGRENWGAPVTDEVMSELRAYVRKILSQYRQVEYHNFEHAYHVVISANKLIDLALNSEIHALSKSKPRMFGLRTDSLMHFLMIFVGLIHDVEHQGIPNRQLAMEDDELAIIYNDQSIAENRSLTIAFRELLQKDYENLRQAIFVNSEEYRRFRKVATQLVLQTDIASPERTQIRKSRWKEAFGEDFQTMEAKVKHELKRRRSTAAGGSKDGGGSHPGSRRMSAASIFSELQQAPSQGDDSPSQTPETSEVGGEDSILEYDKTIMMSKEELEKDDGDTKIPIPGFSRGVSGSGSHAKKAMDRIVRPSVGGDEHPPVADTESFKKFQKRLSSSAGQTRRLRLGIHRSIDLSGEFIETYERRSTMGSNAHLSVLELDEEEDEDEEDDLKVMVILEQIITAADIAHVLQGWKQMEKFSNRLYLELRSAHVQNRGPDCSPNWYGNQIGFLESYILPLAHRLEDMGVFGPLVGPVFARLVEANRDQWITDGQKVTGTYFLSRCWSYSCCFSLS